MKIDCGWMGVACVGFDIGYSNRVGKGVCRKKCTTNRNRM
jgi:hypothetical protein